MPDVHFFLAYSHLANNILTPGDLLHDMIDSTFRFVDIWYRSDMNMNEVCEGTQSEKEKIGGVQYIQGDEEASKCQTKTETD